MTPRASSSEASHYGSRRCFLASCRMVSQHFLTCLARTVEALHGVELLLPGAPGCPNVVCFSFSNIKWYVVVFGFHCFCQFIMNLCVCRNQTTLQSGNTHDYTVRRQTCCLSRANGVMVVVSGPSMVSVGFRVVRSASDCVCLSHVSGWLG